MLFYKVEGTITNIPAETDDSRRAHRETVRKLSLKSDAFNRKYGKASYYFVSDCTDGLIAIGVIADRSDDVRETIKAYMRYIGIQAKNVVTTEITINGIENLLGCAARQDYINDDDEILERFGLDKVTRFGRSIL